MNPKDPVKHQLHLDSGNGNDPNRYLLHRIPVPTANSRLIRWTRNHNHVNA